METPDFLQSAIHHLADSGLVLDTTAFSEIEDTKTDIYLIINKVSMLFSILEAIIVFSNTRNQGHELIFKVEFKEFISSRLLIRPIPDPIERRLKSRNIKLISSGTNHV